MNLTYANRKKISHEDALLMGRYNWEFKRYKSILERENFSELPQYIQELYALKFQDAYLKYSIGLSKFFENYFGNSDIYIGHFLFDTENNLILYEYEV